MCRFDPSKLEWRDRTVLISRTEREFMVFSRWRFSFGTEVSRRLVFCKDGLASLDFINESMTHYQAMENSLLVEVTHLRCGMFLFNPHSFLCFSLL